MDAQETRPSFLDRNWAYLVMIAFVAASAYFAGWGYDLTGRYDRWGETIWENDNWFGAAFFGAGVTCAIVFSAFFAHRLSLRLFGRRAVATITKVEARQAVFETRSELHRELGGPGSALNPHSQKRATVFAKCFRFTAADGETYEVPSDVQTNRVFQVGEEVPVLYFRWNPQRARLYNHLEFYAVVYLFSIAGFVMTTVGALVLELLD